MPIIAIMAGRSLYSRALIAFLGPAKNPLYFRLPYVPQTSSARDFSEQFWGFSYSHSNNSRRFPNGSEI